VSYAESSDEDDHDVFAPRKSNRGNPRRPRITTTIVEDDEDDFELDDNIGADEENGLERPRIQLDYANPFCNR
jgi:hypothetical protein